MATSAIQICSNALLLLGQGSINTFDEDQTGLTANLWDTARQATLRMGTWSCARKRVELAPLATAPAFDWIYAFQLPSDYLRVVSIGNRNETPEYEMEDRKILTDVDAISLRYVYDNTSVPSWDALLAEAVTMHMAVLMAYPLTKSKAVQDAMQANFVGLLQMARGVNGDEAPVDRLGDSPLFNARGHTRSGGVLR